MLIKKVIREIKLFFNGTFETVFDIRKPSFTFEIRILFNNKKVDFDFFLSLHYFDVLLSTDQKDIDLKDAYLNYFLSEIEHSELEFKILLGAWINYRCSIGMECIESSSPPSLYSECDFHDVSYNFLSKYKDKTKRCLDFTFLEGNHVKIRDDRKNWLHTYNYKEDVYNKLHKSCD